MSYRGTRRNGREHVNPLAVRTATHGPVSNWPEAPACRPMTKTKRAIGITVTVLVLAVIVSAGLLLDHLLSGITAGLL